MDGSLCSRGTYAWINELSYSSLYVAGFRCLLFSDVYMAVYMRLFVCLFVLFEGAGIHHWIHVSARSELKLSWIQVSAYSLVYISGFSCLFVLGSYIYRSIRVQWYIWLGKGVCFFCIYMRVVCFLWSIYDLLGL